MPPSAAGVSACTFLAGLWTSLSGSSVAAANNSLCIQFQLRVRQDVKFADTMHTTYVPTYPTSVHVFSACSTSRKNAGTRLSELRSLKREPLSRRRGRTGEHKRQ